MKKPFLFFYFLLFTSVVFSQYTLRLIVSSVATKNLDDIYVAGTFNNWDSANPAYKLKPFGGARKAIVLKDLAAGTYEFKFTRGGWSRVETTAKGEDVSNHSIKVDADVSQEFVVAGWKDNFPDKPKPFTATPQVHLEDSAFNMPQLNRARRIWIYLPKSYATAKGRSYPVLYMQDGQNLFNEQTAPFGEWGIDECLDTLQKQLNKECIIVGIDNGGDKRTTEYNPYDNKKYGREEGREYITFIAETLKPYIDAKYRTLKDRTHTYIAGSSLGALVSLYAVLQYPQVFGAAGMFSPAFWIVPEMYADVQSKTWDVLPRFYFYAGGSESETMVDDMKKMYNIIAAKHNYDIQELVFPPGKHNEAEWRKQFPAFYRWLMK